MKRAKGFTFIEIMVTLMIIITLSLLSFPLYTGRASGDKSKLAEGYALLGYVINAQVAYFNEYGNFLSHHNSGYWSSGSDARGNIFFTSKDNILGINAINNRYFSYFCPFGNHSVNNNEYKFHFTAIVTSKDNGRISLEYNLTKRFEPIVSEV